MILALAAAAALYVTGYLIGHVSGRLHQVRLAVSLPMLPVVAFVPLLLVLAGIVLIGACSPANAAPRSCGTERSAIKLGLDAEAPKLSTEPASTTIYNLVNLPRPGHIPESARASDVERMVWTVTATVTGYRAEGDGDYHIVIVDGNQRMIVEIPDPD